MERIPVTWNEVLTYKKVMTSLRLLYIVAVIFTSVNEAAASIYQSSVSGESAKITFDMSVSGGISQCCDLKARGNVTLLDTILNLDTSFFDFFSEAADMFIAVKSINHDGSVQACAMYGGYDYDYPGCGKIGHWPSSWETSSDGRYSATADMGRANLAGDRWSVCVGNGWSGDFFSVGYEGEISFSSDLITYEIPPSPAPTISPTASPTLSHRPTAAPIIAPTFHPTHSPVPSAAPTPQPSVAPTITLTPTVDPLQVISNCGDPVTISFDASLSGGETACMAFNANATLSTIDADMTYGGGNDDEVVGDFVVVVYHLGEFLGIQVGGHEYFIPGVSYVGPWPLSWQNNSAGHYVADVNVSTYHLGGTGNSSDYSMCITNGWYYGEKEHYAGTATFHGLIHDCTIPPPTPPPFSAPTKRPTPSPTRAPSALPSVLLSPSAVPSLKSSLVPMQSPTVEPTSTASPSPTPYSSPPISVSSGVGEATVIGLNVVLSPGEECQVDAASTGTLTTVSVNVTYTPSTSTSSGMLSDMVVLIRELSSSSSVDEVSGICVQIGGTSAFSVSQYEDCDELHTYEWPSSFDSSVSGVYSAEVNVLFSSLSWSGMWRVR